MKPISDSLLFLPYNVFSPTYFLFIIISFFFFYHTRRACSLLAVSSFLLQLFGPVSRKWETIQVVHFSDLNWIAVQKTKGPHK